jgi:DNA topoisomerase-1
LVDDEYFAYPSSPPPASNNNKTTPKVKREGVGNGGGDNCARSTDDKSTKDGKIVATKEKATKIAVKREGDKSPAPASTKNGGAIKKKKRDKKGDKRSPSSAAPKRSASSSSSSSSSAKKKAGGAGGGVNVLKAMEKSERISHGMQAHLWWDAPDPPEGCQWSKMEHAGVSFPDPYVPHGVRMTYDGKEVRLNPNEEEAATFFASMDPEGMHLGNPKTAPIFVRNFMADFRAVLGRDHVVRDFDKCDFGPMRRHLEEQKLVRKAITDVERKTNKGAKDAAMFRFGYALVDGHLEKVGNYNSE